MVVVRVWERGDCFSIGLQFQVCKRKRVLEMDGGDGRTTAQMYLMPLARTRQIVKMVHIMLCVRYHNEKKERS